MSRVFMLLDFLQKCNLYQGGILPHLRGKTHPSQTKLFALNIYSKITVQVV